MSRYEDDSRIQSDGGHVPSHPTAAPAAPPAPEEQAVVAKTAESATPVSQTIETSLHRASTPSFLPEDERIVESWIQQSLTMPSATLPGEVDGSFQVDAGVPSTTHRRERSMGSGFFVENDYSGVYTAATNTQQATPGFANTGTTPRSNNASHPFFNSDFHSSWSNHSSSHAAAEDFLGFSSPSILGATASPLNANITGASDRPLTVSRVSSTSPSREDDVGGVSSVIHDAARITNWQTVVELCQSQPEAAAYIGRDGWTALHHACNRRCPYPNVVEALIKAYPDALLVEEEKGWLPLHYACRFKAPKDVVRLLLHLYPEKGRFGVSRPDRKGRSPLYYAVRYDAPAGVVSLLLEVDASAVLEEDQNADSPLALVWDAWAEKMDGKRTLARILGGGMDDNNSHHSSQQSINSATNDTADSNSTLSANASSGSIETDPLERAEGVRKRLESQLKILDKWNTVNVFLKAAFGFALDEDWEMVENSEEKKKDSPPGNAIFASAGRKWRILHAVSSIKCHHSLFLLAAALHPEQAFEVDNNDLKRIDNIYKSNRGMGHRPCGVLAKQQSIDYPVNLTALHLAASSRASEDAGKIVLMQLLALNPMAAESVDSEGSTPLHRIAENKFKSNWLVDGVSEIYNANPNAVRAADSNGRLPLHRAAIAITYHEGLEDEVLAARSKICQFLRENEDAAHHPDNFGCLPLHLVAQHGKSWDGQVQALHNANDAAIRTRTGVKYGNRLPLHLCAANSNSDFSLVSKLVELHPRGASQADRFGYFPLHLACESGLSWEMVQTIYEAFPEAIRQPERNKRVWHPLHMAASAENADDELISNLVRLDPTAASIADSNDRYPLHLACMAGKTWETGLSTLFDANPNAISCPDKDGLLPLYIVSLKYCAKPSANNGPKVIDVRSRRLSKSAASLEAEQATAKEVKEAKEVGNLFNLIKADPTAL
mmetsp:Transcript_1745/g.2886  ORF Transcript_1745/g.2886 Transcript_1745/m.2886 type:complete len:947 (-) Transcript_1745:51-2891(-)